MNDYISRQAAIEAASKRWGAIEAIEALPAADLVPVVRCKDCIHNNDCDIQYSAQAGENFFCGFGETEKDVREYVYG